LRLQVKHQGTDGVLVFAAPEYGKTVAAPVAVSAERAHHRLSPRNIAAPATQTKPLPLYSQRITRESTQSTEAGMHYQARVDASPKNLFQQNVEQQKPHDHH
jgi:hypothetical protein